MLLTVKEVTKSFANDAKDITVLNGVSFELDAGETLALTGESGCGKSTLLHLIGGLDTATSGSINLDGKEMTKLDDAGRAAMRRGMVGVVFQQFNLIPSLTVEANISFQARLAGTFDAGYCTELATRLGIHDQLSKYPEALSGGQQQRVALARTLAAKPKLILADEPTGNLDEANAAVVLDLICSIPKETGTAVLMVTHSQTHAARMDRRLHLTKGRVA